MNYTTVPLFPSPVIQVQVEEDTSELLTYNEPLTVSNEQIDRYKNKGSDKRVLENYPKTKEILLDIFTNVAEEELGYKRRSYAITTSWITLSNKGEGSQLHKHKNSFWSGVYYFQEEYPEGTGGILFDNPNTDLFDFSFQSTDIENFNNINSLTCTFHPSPNLLLFFPSYLEHQVMTHNLDKSRSSLAFNIVPLGGWGDGDSSYDHSWVTPSLKAWR
tara:strand:- start:52 stop:702 length:651 start_codon:yes stop_codon:yes gene_type:complete